MSIHFAPLTIETLPALKHLVLPFWDRTWDDAVCDRIFRWRFLERSDGEAILAFDGDRCIAMIDSWVRRYIVDNEICHVREMADWYSHADYRGAGLEPVWMMMRRPEPSISAGGTIPTQRMLPRLGWKPMPQQFRNFILPLNSSVLLEGLFRRSKIPGSAQLASLARHIALPIGRIRNRVPQSGEAGIRPMLPLGVPSTMDCASPSYALARLVDESELEWLHSAPREMGEFGSLVFSLDGKAVGISVYRLLSRSHRREGCILHIQASQVSTRSYAWMASETAAYLVRRGATMIRCRTSCLFLARALRQTGFYQRPALIPMWWWPKNGELPKGNALLSFLRADDGICPYPTNLEVRRNLSISSSDPVDGIRN